MGKVVKFVRTLTPKCARLPMAQPQSQELQALAVEHPDWLWYLASPYAHPTDWMKELRFRAAARIGGVLYARYRIHTFGPIAHSHPLAMELASYREPNTPNSGSFWLPFDKPFQSRCDGLMVAELPGWQYSNGVGEEQAIFRAAQKPEINLECRQWFTHDEWKLLGGT